jgi:hypothetical protein
MLNMKIFRDLAASPRISSRAFLYSFCEARMLCLSLLFALSSSLSSVFSPLPATLAPRS